MEGNLKWQFAIAIWLYQNKKASALQMLFVLVKWTIECPNYLPYIQFNRMLDYQLVRRRFSIQKQCP